MVLVCHLEDESINLTTVSLQKEHYSPVELPEFNMYSFRKYSADRVSATGPVSVDAVTDDATVVVPLKPPPFISLGEEHSTIQ